MNDPNPLRRNFMDLMCAQWTEEKFVCVGLAPNYDQIRAAGQYKERPDAPRHFTDTIRDAAGEIVGSFTLNVSLNLTHGTGDAIRNFGLHVIDQVGEVAGAISVSLAHYLAYGPDGIAALIRTVKYAHARHPKILIILNAEFSGTHDANQMNLAFAQSCEADAITVSPHWGKSALMPFLAAPDLGVIISCNTSTKSDWDSNGRNTGEHIVSRISNGWNERGNCLLGANALDALKLSEARIIAPNLPIVVGEILLGYPNLETSVSKVMRADKDGFLIMSPDNLIFADDPFREVTELNKSINTLRKAARP